MPTNREADNWIRWMQRSARRKAAAERLEQVMKVMKKPVNNFLTPAKK